MRFTVVEALCVLFYAGCAGVAWERRRRAKEQRLADLEDDVQRLKAKKAKG